MGPPALCVVFRKETQGAFLQFLSHKAQYETWTSGRAAISCREEVSVPKAYFCMAVSLFHIKNGTGYRSHFRFTYFFVQRFLTLFCAEEVEAFNDRLKCGCTLRAMVTEQAWT